MSCRHLGWKSTDAVGGRQSQRLNRQVCSLKERDEATRAWINATLNSERDDCPFARAEDQPRCPWYEKQA